MTEAPKGYGEQLFQRLREQGLSRGQVYKVLALQRLCDEVMQLGADGTLTEATLLEISRIESPARQKQLAEIVVERDLPAAWVRALSHLIRSAERAATDREANLYWDFFFEVEDALEREGPNKTLLEKVKSFKGAGPAEGVEGMLDRRLTDFRKIPLRLGRGLDVGTSNIVASVHKEDGGLVYNIQRNAFLDVRSDTFTRKMLMKLGVDHFVHAEKGYVIGDPAFELANIFEKNTRRPMRDGMISPTEAEAIVIEKMIIQQVLGRPQEQDEVCAFSIPADPIDTERNVVYHKGSLESILRGLGYSPKALLEGHAVVFAELVEEEFTGIGISCGAGMFNICIAYKSLPALTFSTSRGGDWIDNNVSHALGLPSSHVCAIKESGIDLSRPRDRVEEAICIYYRSLIHYSLDTIRVRFESAQNMPTFTKPVTLVCSGGTSMVKGFIDVFRSEFERIEFPIEVKEIRLAKDPLRTVAMGCLEAAQEETRARALGGLPGPQVNVGRAEPTPKTSVPIQIDPRTWKIPLESKEAEPPEEAIPVPEAPPAAAKEPPGPADNALRKKKKPPKHEVESAPKTDREPSESAWNAAPLETDQKIWEIPKDEVPAESPDAKPNADAEEPAPPEDRARPTPKPEPIPNEPDEAAPLEFIGEEMEDAASAEPAPERPNRDDSDRDDREGPPLIS